MTGTAERTLPNVVTREEWLTARRRLLAREKEETHLRDTVNAERRALPMVEVDKAYAFDGPANAPAAEQGERSLEDLFDGRRQLIVYHAMFHPDWDAACPGCSFLIDNIGHLAHLHAADTTLVIVSRAPLERIEPFQRRMGWTMPWFSSYGSDFNYDFHATLDPSVAPAEYNFEPAEVPDGESGEVPGTSVFLREGGRIYHTYSSYARGGDILLGTFNYLDLTPFGRQEEAGTMAWLRHHDRYDPD